MIEMFRSLWRTLTKAITLVEGIVDLGHDGLGAIKRELTEQPPEEKEKEKEE